MSSNEESDHDASSDSNDHEDASGSDGGDNSGDEAAFNQPQFSAPPAASGTLTILTEESATPAQLPALELLRRGCAVAPDVEVVASVETALSKYSKRILAGLRPLVGAQATDMPEASVEILLMTLLGELNVSHVSETPLICAEEFGTQVPVVPSEVTPIGSCGSFVPIDVSRSILELFSMASVGMLSGISPRAVALLNAVVHRFLMKMGATALEHAVSFSEATGLPPLRQQDVIRAATVLFPTDVCAFAETMLRSNGTGLIVPVQKVATALSKLSAVTPEAAVYVAGLIHAFLQDTITNACVAAVTSVPDETAAGSADAAAAAGLAVKSLSYTHVANVLQDSPRFMAALSGAKALPFLPSTRLQSIPIALQVEPSRNEIMAILAAQHRCGELAYPAKQFASLLARPDKPTFFSFTAPAAGATAEVPNEMFEALSPALRKAVQCAAEAKVIDVVYKCAQALTVYMHPDAASLMPLPLGVSLFTTVAGDLCR